jgi:hypothetical protein
MKHQLSALALAAAGAVVASVSAHAAQVGTMQRGYLDAAVAGPGFGTVGAPRDVIEPPSSIDPGMALDPPRTGAKMPVVRPPDAPPGGRLVLPR